MTLDELTELSARGALDALRVHSLQGGYYLLQAVQGGDRSPVRDEQGVVLLWRSLLQVRQCLEGRVTLPLELWHAEVHEELCGLPEQRGEACRLSLANPL